jgi:hypothetical protein
VGTIITDGQEGIACFDRSPISSPIRVDINYVPPQVEVVTVSISGVPAPTTLENAIAVWSAVQANTLTNEATKARQMQTNKAVISSDGLSVSIYADDDVTLLHSFSVSADKNTRTPV